MKKIFLFLTLILCLSLILTGCSFPTGNTKMEKTQNTHSTVKAAAPADKKEAAPNTHQSEIVNTAGWIHVAHPAQIPILMYHSISSGGNSLHVPAAEFSSEMKWIKDHGYDTLTPEEANLVLTKDMKPKKKCVLITLDDGYQDNYTSAFPILKKYHMHATIFMIGKSIGRHNHLTKPEMLQVAENGISIQSHTIHHLELSLLSDADQQAELVQSKQLFDRILHQKTLMVSYPSGRYNPETLKLSEQAGYKMAVTTEPGAASRTQGMFALHRIRIVPGMSLVGFGRILDRAN